ncbi:FAD-dependent oxidoreductase [Zavarzinella formosa]|uniref:FAD-dependent oxidoreductase n=1 Tax=Zavarzinella formosa TaxID=360055 RepID=UPI00036711DC|nr:FAD-dependent oxidoreductase [Zavarzinella formosa]
MTQQIDTLVIGAGLAGCTLARQLDEAGKAVILADREETVTSSKVAAGLIAPLSGPRLLPSWRFAPAWDAAIRYYTELERQFQIRLYHPRNKLHLFSSEGEREIFHRERLVQHSQYIFTPSPAIDSEIFHAPLGGFEMTHAGWLDVPAFLKVIKKDFADRGILRTTNINAITDLYWDGPRVEIPRLGLSASMVIWCEGPTATANPFLPGIRFNPAKGEVLTLRIPDLRDDRILYRGVWLVQLEGEIFRCGSTYDWVDLQSEPSTAGREQILGRLREFLKLPVEVIGHAAAVRPVIEDVRPMFGIHPHCRRLGFFNGLGSKGALLAPLMAKEFASQMETGKQNSDPETSLTRKAGIQLPPRLTEMAQSILEPLIAARDVVIDATAGNGHDTMFLAKRVRNRGLVFAIDRQPAAINRLNQSLAENPFRQVKPILGNHAELAALIPPEHHGLISAIMFNLGYLPRGDKEIKTSAETTRPAIQQAVCLLRPGGTMTIMAYTGHPGGPEEAAAVIEALRELEDMIEWKEHFGEPWMKNPPRLLVVRKK